MKRLIPFLLIFIFCSENSIPPNLIGLEELIPSKCTIHFGDRTEKIDCESLFDESLNGFVWSYSENEKCENAVLTYYFQNAVKIDYLILENLATYKEYKIRDRLKILETTYDDFGFKMDSFYPEDTSEIQYFGMEREKTQQINIYVIRAYQSENYFLSSSKNECAFGSIKFYG
jgi:hypothetical protein